MLVWIWGKGTYSLRGVKTSEGTMEVKLEVPQKN